jgi:transcriptional regulator with XRE-family HTH domain
VSVPPEVAEAVAVNVRRIRAARGWSLEGLAGRSGVSKGMLVQLEQARTNPSLGTLCRVAEALSVTLAALVETSEPPSVQVVPAGGGTELWTGPHGGTARLLVGSDEREHVELWDWQLGPGDTHVSADPHIDGTLEMLHVVEGAMVLEVDGEEYAVGTGCAASFRGDRPHAYRNDDPEVVCRFVLVVLQQDVDLEGWASLRIANGLSSSG